RNSYPRLIGRPSGARSTISIILWHTFAVSMHKHVSVEDPQSPRRVASTAAGRWPTAYVARGVSTPVSPSMRYDARRPDAVPGAKTFRRLDPERRIGGQTAGVGIKLELHNHIGPRVVPWRFQDVIVEPGDVRHKGKLVGRIGLYGVGAGGRGQPVEGRGTHR